MKKLQSPWLGVAAWFAIVAAAVVACSSGADVAPAAPSNSTVPAQR